jgi:hypothetical protein
MLAETTDTAAAPPKRRRRPLPSFTLCYLAAAMLPPMLIYFSIAGSQTLGFMLATAIILLRADRTVARRWPLRRLLPVVLSLVVLHFLIAASLQPTDAPRALMSLLPLALLLLSARYLAVLLPALPQPRLHRDVLRCFFVMCGLAVLAVIGVQPPSVEEWRKSVFPFFEPAVFALPFAPLLLYACISVSGRTRLGHVVLGLISTMLIQNLTLATCFLLVVAVSFRWWALVAVAGLFAVGGAQLDLTYYTSRLDFSGEVINLSNLVYIQGWQMIPESWDRSGGFGLGFQQLGAQGTDVPAAQVIRGLRDGEDLNVLDGGFVLSKLSSEFGVFGMLLALAFIALAMRSFFALRRIGTHRLKAPAFVTLAHCSVLAYSIELLVRGGSYFTGTTMLLVASLGLLYGRRAAPAPRRRPGRKALPHPAAA